MGYKKSLILLLISFIFESCSCFEEADEIMTLSNDQKLWFSSGPKSDSIMVFNGNKNWNDYIVFHRNPPKTGLEEDGSGSCSPYRKVEYYQNFYESRFSYRNWTFNLNTVGGGYKFLIVFNNTSGGYSECRVVLNLNNLEEVKEFSYFPYNIEHQKGLRYIGDTTLKGVHYSDLFTLEFNLPANAYSNDISKFYLSKRIGLVGYITFDTAFWTPQ